MNLVTLPSILKANMSTLKKTGFYNTTDNESIYYESYGESGPILVFTYGLACPLNHWHKQVSHFSQDHRVLLYDLRGHNKSSLNNPNLSLEVLARDAYELSQFLYPNEKAFFIGHSFGCPISFLISILYKEQIKGSVLINGFYKNPFEKFLTKDQCIKIIESLELMHENAPELSQWIWSKGSDSSLFQILAGLTGGFNLERTDFKDIEIYTKGLASLSFSTFLIHFKTLFKFDGSDHLNEESLSPSLIIHGGRDGIVPLDQNQDLGAMKNACFLNLPEGSHCTQLDLPFETNKAIEGFIQSNY